MKVGVLFIREIKLFSENRKGIGEGDGVCVDMIKIYQNLIKNVILKFSILYNCWMLFII